MILCSKIKHVTFVIKHWLVDMEELPDQHVALLNLGSCNEKTKFKSAYFILAENATFIPEELNFFTVFSGS